MSPTVPEGRSYGFFKATLFLIHLSQPEDIASWAPVWDTSLSPWIPSEPQIALTSPEEWLSGKMPSQFQDSLHIWIAGLLPGVFLGSGFAIQGAINSSCPEAIHGKPPVLPGKLLMPSGTSSKGKTRSHHSMAHSPGAAPGAWLPKACSPNPKNGPFIERKDNRFKIHPTALLSSPPMGARFHACLSNNREANSNQLMDALTNASCRNKAHGFSAGK